MPNPVNCILPRLFAIIGGWIIILSSLTSVFDRKYILLCYIEIRYSSSGYETLNWKLNHILSFHNHIFIQYLWYWYSLFKRLISMTQLKRNLYFQAVQKLMEEDGNPASPVWKSPLMLHSKDAPANPLTTFTDDRLQAEATKLFKVGNLK